MFKSLTNVCVNETALSRPLLRIACDISLYYRTYIMQLCQMITFIAAIMMKISPPPFMSCKPHQFSYLLFMSALKILTKCNGCPLACLSYLAPCGSIGSTDDFTPDLAVFSSCEYSQYSGIELRSPGCNVVRVMNLMTSQQPDLKAHACQKSVAAYPSKPGHLFLLILTFMAANMVLGGVPKRLSFCFQLQQNID